MTAPWTVTPAMEAGFAHTAALIAAAARRRWQDPEMRARMLAGFGRARADPDLRDRVRAAHRRLWAAKYGVALADLDAYREARRAGATHAEARRALALEKRRREREERR